MLTTVSFVVFQYALLMGLLPTRHTRPLMLVSGVGNIFGALMQFSMQVRRQRSAGGLRLPRSACRLTTREIATVSARGAVVGRRSAAAVGGCRRRRRQNTELILRCVV